ncbi:FAD-dependent monooxygenase [Streptomyces brevispora]|uniref:FAD-dependent monooxygenase n=1 Tax=Streptomyces brevispora TaxID=887462 RepID=UPI002E2F34DE|nr:FAD-dependent monooxygenase [Streptomyces brevispora]
MTPTRADVPVLIVGAGPVGLLLACGLGRARVPVVLVEKLARPTTESRATQLSTRTAELLHKCGFDDLLAEAAHEPRTHFGGLGFDLTPVDSPYAGNWKVPQYRTEAALGARATELGAETLRSHRLTGLTEQPDHVLCRIQGPEGPLELRAAYVAGCDGAHSTVRRLAGIPVTATPATKELLRADIRGLNLRDRRFERLTNGFAVANTRDGITRIMVHAFGGTVPTRTGPPRFTEITDTWRHVTGEDISGGTPLWLDAFDNAKGQADSYRRGRILLAGDAAHWHPPVGGQALNTGLQDAADLGPKLAETVHGTAAPGLLDSYHEARHPAAARVLDHVAAQEQLMLDGPETEPLRAVLSELIGLDEVRAHLTSMASNLNDRLPAAKTPMEGRNDSAGL